MTEIDEFQGNLHTAVQMILQTESEPKFVLVEGSPDKKYFRQIFNLDKVFIENARGRDNVSTIVNSLSQAYEDRIIGICDKDFLWFDIGTHIGSNILHTDTHDLQIDALIHGNFMVWLNMNCELEKHKVSAQTVVSLAMGIAVIISFFRLLNEQDENLNIEFDTYNLTRKSRSVGDAFQKGTFSPDIKSIITRICQSENNKSYLGRVDEFVDKITIKISEDFEIHQVCNGHDFTKALLLVLNKKFGTKFIKGIPLKNDGLILDSLLGSYPPKNFFLSDLGNKLQNSHSNFL